MENRVQPKERTDDERRAFLAMIVFLICVECAKEPEFRCDYCGKVYKQEGRYHSHIAKCNMKEDSEWGCIAGIARPVETSCHVSTSEFSELLRQNREMMVLLQKQQETIQVLVAQLVPVAAK